MDVVREGFDLVLRTGAVLDESLIALPLGELELLNCASPAYLRRHGKPQTLQDLSNPQKAHRLVHFAATLGGRSSGFEYVQDGKDRSLPLPGAVTVSSADKYDSKMIDLSTYFRVLPMFDIGIGGDFGNTTRAFRTSLRLRW